MWTTREYEDLRLLMILDLYLEGIDGAAAYHVADFILELGDEAVKQAAALVWPFYKTPADPFREVVAQAEDAVQKFGQAASIPPELLVKNPHD